ncbi:hypothetical protein [Demequina sp. NBRC 110056]|uniref:hypothetical protein n=1 Tax=Demequina sp. NBRC 110056 TaxID=1570345 RepID=UPI000A02DFE5|nr:hypothetical protein [Demequina sp. NBRC 110056]
MATSFARLALAALGGAFAANAAPHGWHALRGEPFPSPFADPPGVGLSPPAHNLAWSAINAGAAGALLAGARIGRSPAAAAVAVASAAAAGLAVSRYFATVPERREALARAEV